jgi:glutathione reductase (NADPH)
VTPSVVFSQPPLASVGMTQREAADRGLDVEVRFTDTSEWWSSRRVGLLHTGAKTITDRLTGAILGAHLLGHGADEMANLFALAIDRGMSGDDLKSLLWAYPTAGSEIVYLV